MACIIGLYLAEIIIAMTIAYFTNASTLEVLLIGDDVIQLMGYLIVGIFDIIFSGNAS